MKDEFFVSFESNLEPFNYHGFSGRKLVKTTRLKRSTLCRVWQKDAVVAEGGSANCFNDQDCKFDGQKAALTNALKNVPKKPLRAKVWAQFFSQSKKGRLLVGRDEDKN